MTATTTRAAIRNRSRGLAPLAVVFLGVGLSAALSFPFLSLFLTTAVHAGPVKLSFFLLAQPLSGIAVSTFLGRLSDGRVARRRVLMLCTAAGCVSALVFSMLRSYWPLLLLACTVTAIAMSLMAQGFGYARAVLGDDPSAPMVTNTLRTFFSLAWVAGPPLASLLLTAGGFTAMYLCSAALYAVVLGIVALWLSEPAARPRAESHQAEVAVADGARRSLWMTLAALVLLQGAIWLNVQAIPLLARHELHAGVGSAGVVLGVCAALEIPAMLGFGALSGRLPLQRLIRIGPVFGIAYYALVSVCDQVWQLGVAQVLDACYIAVIQGLAISYVQLMLPFQPGRASTLYSNTYPCGTILASPLLGLGARFGYRVSFVAAAVAALGGLILLMAARPVRQIAVAPR